MSAVIAAKSAIATSIPPGTLALIADGHQSADGRMNHAKNDIGPFHGDMSPVPVGVSARSNAVSQTTPTVR